MEIGDYARYVNTGTVGIIEDIMEEEGVRWILLDKTQLYYDESTLEPAKPEEYRKVSEKKSLDRSLEEIRRMKESMEGFEDIVSDITATGT